MRRINFFLALSALIFFGAGCSWFAKETSKEDLSYTVSGKPPSPLVPPVKAPEIPAEAKNVPLPK